MSREAAKPELSPEEQVQKLTAELERANKELESLSYAVSHDLRAPLRAIEGFANIVVEDYKDKLDSEGQRFLDIIRCSGLKASRMIDGLLSYSRMGRHEMTLSDIDTTELVKQTIADLQDGTVDKKIDFVAPQLPNVHGDFFLVREIWKLLLENAIKFSRQQAAPKIEIGSREQNGNQIFFIKDNGVGFDMNFSDKLFNLFQRLHGEAEFEGIGVGLAIAQRLVIRHGGKIWAEAKPNEGATFFFSLPK